jgi:hypothetical protein
MRPIERLIALGVTWLDAVHTAELVATEARDLYDTCVEADPDSPEMARVFFRVLVTTRALQTKLNQRVEGLTREVIQYYRAYLTALDESSQVSVYEDALYTLRKWGDRPDAELPQHPATVRGIIEVLDTWQLPATDEIQILGEIHRALHDAIKEDAKREAFLKAHAPVESQ